MLMALWVVQVVLAMSRAMVLSHSRQILQMDVGGMPHTTFLKSIELLGTRVLPRNRTELESR